MIRAITMSHMIPHESWRPIHGRQVRKDQVSVELGNGAGVERWRRAVWSEL